MADTRKLTTTVVAIEDQIISGHFITKNGDQLATDTYTCCDYLPVYITKGTVIEINSTVIGSAGLAWFDQNKKVISGIDATNASEYGITPGQQPQKIIFTATTNIYYFRATILTAYYKQPDDFNIKYESYAKTSALLNANNEISIVQQSLITDEKNISELLKTVDGIKYSNLIDISKLKTDSYIVTTTGEIATSSYFKAIEEYIYLKPNTSFYVGNVYLSGFYAFYDNDKKFVAAADATITKSSSSEYNGTITTHDIGYYFRGSVLKSSTTPFISNYYNTYHDCGIVTLETVIKSSINKSIRNKVLVIGDSISTDYYGNYDKWVTDLINEGFLPKETTNSSIHATGFVVRYNSQENDFISRITAIENKSNYDLVVIFGGINDFMQSVPMGGGEGQTDITVYFKPAVDYFFNYLIQNFTQARLCVLLPLRTFNTYPNSQGEYQQAYSAYIQQVARSYCLPILNLTEDSGFCPYITTFRDMWTLKPEGYSSTDGVHPNATYEKEFLAPMIKKFLTNL